MKQALRTLGYRSPARAKLFCIARGLAEGVRVPLWCAALRPGRHREAQLCKQGSEHTNTLPCLPTNPADRRLPYIDPGGSLPHPFARRQPSSNPPLHALQIMLPAKTSQSPHFPQLPTRRPKAAAPLGLGFHTTQSTTSPAYTTPRASPKQLALSYWPG